LVMISAAGNEAVAQASAAAAPAVFRLVRISNGKKFRATRNIYHFRGRGVT
jgi:hypothetical protein